MVQILERPPSFGENLTSRFIQGLGGGFDSGMAIAEKLAGRKAKKEADRGKLAGNASKDFSSYAKTFHPTIYEDKNALEKASSIYRQLIEENPEFSDEDKEDAFRLAVQKSREKLPGEPQQESKRGFFNIPKPEKSLLEYLSQSKEGQPESLLQRFTKMGKGEPISAGKFLGGLGLGAVAPFEEAFSFGPKQKFEGEPQTINDLRRQAISPASTKKGASEFAREKLEEGLSPDQREQLATTELIGSAIPWGSISKTLVNIPGLKGFWRSANKIGKESGIGTQKAAENLFKKAAEEGIDVAKVAAGDAVEVERLNSLSGRVAKGSPSKAAATEMRISRTEPEAKTFKTSQEESLREKQLSGYKKLEDEILADSADKSLRRERALPKTEAGKISLQGRIHMAEKALPRIKEDYYKSISRLRGIEDQLSTLSKSEQKAYEGILKAAQKDLKEAEFSLESAVDNSKTGKSKTSLEEMRKAAQEKVTGISDKISGGEEVKLPLRDYNPEFVKQGKSLSRKKPLPGQDRSDYFTQVHSEYADQYRNQLGRIQGEIKSLPRNISGAQRLRELEKEKDILNKMIDHIDAENTIHRRKLALRGMHERQKAQERFKKLEIQKNGGKTSEVGRQKIQEQARETVKNPTGPEAEKLAAKAHVKKEQVQEAVQDIQKTNEEIKSTSAFRPLKTLMKEIKKFADVWSRKPWYKAFTHTPLGQEVLFTLGDVAADMAFGKGNIYSSFIPTVHPKRVALALVRKSMMAAYKLGREEYYTQQYVNAVKTGGEEGERKRAEIAKNHRNAAKEGRERLKSL